MKQTISRSSLAVMLQLTTGLIPTGFVVASATSATAQTASGAAQLELLWRTNTPSLPLIAVADNLPVGFNGSVNFVEGGKPAISIPLGNLGAGQNTIASGKGFLCYITPTNGVKCWGVNDKGQLGNGGNANVGKAGATDVKFGSDALTGVFAITAGDSHACAIMRDDLSVKCWGANESGQLGNNTQVSSTSAVNVSIANIVSIAAGSSHTCAVETSSSVKCWGSDTSGQLGDGDDPKAGAIGPPLVAPAQPAINGRWRSRTASSNIAKKSLVSSGYFAIASGGTGNCAINTFVSRQEIGCWGQITFQQEGPDSSQTADAFKTRTQDNYKTTTAYNGRAIGVAMSNFHTCAITANSTVACGVIRSTDTVSIPLVTASSRLAVGLPRPAALAVKEAVSPDVSIVCALLEDRITCSGIKSTTKAPVIVGDRQEFMIANARGLTIANMQDGASLCAIRDTGAIACGSLGLSEVSSSNSANAVVQKTLSDVPSATAIRRATAVAPGLRDKDKPVTASLTNGATTLTVTR